MFDQLKKRFRRWRSYRLTLDELERLDAHMLRDLGYGEASRSNLDAFVKCHTAEAYRRA